MTFSKASRTSVLAALSCLLLMGFAGASYGAISFNVRSSPTEVINTGLSEVTGSINLVVASVTAPAENIAGTSTGGDAQIGISYYANGTFMPIDNTINTGIVIFYTAEFEFANPTIIDVSNGLVGGRCAGAITVNLTGDKTSAHPIDADQFIRVEGVRGRIAASSGVTQGTDMYASLQSINDPAANQFSQDVIRIAKSYPGMAVSVVPDSLLLCFATLDGVPPGSSGPNYSIVITEGFARAFVDNDANNDNGTAAGLANDRVDSGGQTTPPLYAPGFVAATAHTLGAPTNSTEVVVTLDSIPASVSSISWPAASTQPQTYSELQYVSDTSDGAGNAIAIYSYQTIDQVNLSDINIETFILKPIIHLKSGATQTGIVNASASLAPYEMSTPGCDAPYVPGRAQPRFVFVREDSPDTSPVVPGADEGSAPYANIIRCNCYMLFSFVTFGGGFNTGIAVANTSQDSQVFPTNGASTQIGNITFYFYSATGGYRGYFSTSDIPFGQSYIGLLSTMIGNSTMPDTTFTGYVIARAEFQYCHAVSYIADDAFAATAQGYAALIIPDPSIKAGYRSASAAADVLEVLPAGESLNN